MSAYWMSTPSLSFWFRRANVGRFSVAGPVYRSDYTEPDKLYGGAVTNDTAIATNRLIGDDVLE